MALGVGRAAIQHTLDSMKKTGVKPGPDETAPHWAFADGATEVAAARMLTYGAAQMLDRGENAEDAITRAQAFAATPPNARSMPRFGWSAPPGSRAAGCWIACRAMRGPCR